MQTRQDSGARAPEADSGPGGSGSGASGNGGAPTVGSQDASAPVGGQVPPCGACLFDEACLGEQVCARFNAGDETGLCVRDTGSTECCTEDGTLTVCVDIPASWSDGYRCPGTEPEVGTECGRQEACWFGTDTSPVLCSCDAEAWICTTCPATAPASDESCEACVGCQHEPLACDFAEDVCTCDGNTWFCTDQRTNAQWETVVREQMEALRGEIGCNEPAQENAHVTDQALAIAEGFDMDGVPPAPSPNLEAGASWYMVLVEDPDQADPSTALSDYLGADAPCTGVSMGIAVTGMPGQTRRVVILMSECVDCGDACRTSCEP